MNDGTAALTLPRQHVVFSPRNAAISVEDDWIGSAWRRQIGYIVVAVVQPAY